MAVHGLTLLIARQSVSDIELFAHAVELRVIPPLCPRPETPYRSAKAGAMIERGNASTREWVDRGGSEEMVVPGLMGSHMHSV